MFGSYGILPSIYPGLCYDSITFDRLNYKDVTKPYMAKLDTVERGVHTLLCYLCYDPVLKYPSFTQPLVLQTDASDRAGAVLSQRGSDGEEHPVAY